MEWDHYNLQRLMGCQEDLFVGFLKKNNNKHLYSTDWTGQDLICSRNPSKNTHIDYTIDSTKPKTQKRWMCLLVTLTSIWEAMSFPRITIYKWWVELNSPEGNMFSISPWNSVCPHSSGSSLRLMVCGQGSEFPVEYWSSATTDPFPSYQKHPAESRVL